MQNKVIIAGCGLSGMITALSLAYYGINSVIIERKNTDDLAFFNDVRTTALTATTKNFLNEINIWSDISKISGNINDIYVVDNKAEDMIHFKSPHVRDELQNGEPMGYLVENNIFKKTLFELVSNNKLIRVIDNIDYKLKNNNDDGCEIILADGRELLAKLLIICDGFNSLLKQNYFSNIINKNYSQYALTFLVKHEKQHDGTAVEHFMPSGPFAILPLKDPHTSSVVWTIKYEMKNVLVNMSSEEFTYILQENFGNFLGRVSVVSEIGAFPLKACIAKNYFNKKMMLLADSAHVIHPLAGQGLNQGIKDIKSLIINILERDISNETLVNYEKERKNDNLIMYEITDKLNMIFQLSYPVFFASRQLGFKAIEKISPLKNLLVSYAMGQR
ncbi:MAG: 2-octaprenyl-6-methoxyphenyl hydroxylase [Rickettsiales bacterium]|nr:MAG: 2-octaprenyl-6-methoxyphenyl hydroxylase [Rickettsiales bacterium]